MSPYTVCVAFYRETVTNALDSLRDQGLVEVKRKEIVVLETERLKNVAEKEMLRKR